MTTRPWTGMPASASLSAKNSASATASRRGDETRMKAVPGSARRSRTRWARSRNPSSIPSNAWKKAMASVTTSPPTTRDTERRKV